MIDQLRHWLTSQQEVLDSIVARSAGEFLKDNKDRENFQYDLKQCHVESYNLVHGRDLCYDRPCTAFAYALWYHPRRINTFLSFFLAEILEQPQSIEVFDLGAGAGAIQCGLGLIYAGLKRLGRTPPDITVINIDTSPFMLAYNRDYLWREFIKDYPEIDRRFHFEYEVNSWGNTRKVVTRNPVLAASYLFDASDNQHEVASDFKRIVDQYQPATILLLTSNQTEKVRFLTGLEKEFKGTGYRSTKVADSSLIFSQPLHKVNAIRKKLGAGLAVSELQRPASWVDNSHAGLILQKAQAPLSFSSATRSISHLDIFNPPIKVRREVVLNDKQKRAARDGDSPAVIVGPAGCGKSIVITEKIRNIVEGTQYSPETKILVTTFNKGLIGKLAEWTMDLLDESRVGIRYDQNFYGYNDKSCHLTFKGSNKTNIRFLHFDMLPKLLGGVRYLGLVDHDQHFNLLREIILKIKKEERITGDQYDHILNPDFLFEEYHRVIYGLQVGISRGEEKYLTVSRTGRGNNPSLPKHSIKRILVWKCLTEYAFRMHRDRIQSFTLRRQYLYGKLKSGEIKIKYDHIFVDEFQDCTNADFEIFFSLLNNPNYFTIAGDLAQSIHLGTAAKIPRDARMERRQFHRLEGSYRLPVRISECIKKLSKAIVARFAHDEGVTDISPYKRSPPGARPIVVYGLSYIELSRKVKAVFEAYRIYDLKEITVLEKDSMLVGELHRLGLAAETDSILSLKGLEKECVLWSTRIPLEFENEVFEFAYTIVTRTSCLLVIGLTEDTQNIYKKVLGLLDRERLIFWDRETELKYSSFCEQYTALPVEDEE